MRAGKCSQNLQYKKLFAQTYTWYVTKLLLLHCIVCRDKLPLFLILAIIAYPLLFSLPIVHTPDCGLDFWPSWMVSPLKATCIWRWTQTIFPMQAEHVRDSPTRTLFLPTLLIPYCLRGRLQLIPFPTKMERHLLTRLSTRQAI